MKKTSIYVCYHKPCDMLPDPIFRYIYCGAAVNGEDNYMPGTLRDDADDNISALNPYFCECTAIYWIWKNDRESEHIGLMHYRRHLNFSSKCHINKYGLIEEEYVSESYIDRYGLDGEHICRIAESNEIVMPERYYDGHSRNNREQFKNSENHNVDDLDRFESILRKNHPEFSEAIAEFNNAKSAYYTNIFILKRDIFDNYCSILFDVLFKLHESIDYYNYNTQERRAPGFVAERFLDIYIRWLSKKSKSAVELQRVYLKHPFVVRKIEYSDVVPVVISVNDYFVKYISACIMSIIDTSNRDKNYKIFILHSGISKENAEVLESMVREVNNFAIDFIDCSWIYSDFKLNEHMHFTRETYYRFAIPQIFQDFEKVIYLDGDTIVKRDIADLLYIDMQDKAIAGVRDYIFEGMCTRKIPCFQDIYHGTADEYAKNYLKVNPCEYIQAGVLLFNINKIRINALDKKLFQYFDRPYWFVDQDILNIVFDGEKFFLDTRWNVANGNGNLDGFYCELPARLSEKYFKALSDPWIIHYAGERKPWFDPGVKYSSEFWKYARKSPFYESILKDMCSLWAMYPRPRHSIKSRLVTIKDFVFPKGTVRHKYAKLLYINVKKLIRVH